ncbi:hypothetical protein H2509_06355 [Stappia sp. F7233]|uniref:Uncharacterized protein n=2 Tax=Stappia albiluteola TaxID=2758565 RepID=A0A839ACJ3_9HYPH|nr:hypothetical protein [Stappia albiluteola]
MLATTASCLLVAASLLLSSGVSAHAGEADVIQVRSTQASDGTWRFDVTVRHADDGWAHYADSFEILAPDKSVLGTRVLLHPHVTEQPFTRSIDGVVIPRDIRQVIVRAHDKVHGYGGEEQTVELPLD